MDAQALAYTEIGETYFGYCCKLKHYYSQDYALVKTLDITPRIIIYNHHLKISQNYTQNIQIKNNGLYPRRLKFSTDCPTDIAIEVSKDNQIKDIPPEGVVNVYITLRPKDKQNINRRRHIFINSEHPNILFEVPIIIVDKVGSSSIPEKIQFPQTVPRTKTFYEFAVYNHSSVDDTIVIKCANPLINSAVKSKRIPRKDYIKIVISLNVKDMRTISDVLKIKLGTKTFVELPFEHVPIARTAYFSTQHLSFDELKFSRNAQKEVTVCNESQEDVQFSLKFLTEAGEMASDCRGGVRYVEVEPIDADGADSLDNSEEAASPAIDQQTNKKHYVQDKLSLDAHRHFGINTKGGQLKPNSSHGLIVVFRPVMDEECHFDDDEDGPFLLATKLILQIRSEQETLTTSTFISGLVLGPSILLTPRSIDLRSIYLGEEYCFNITALNVDGQVKASVAFKDHSLKDNAVCDVKPVDGFDLESCEKGVFTLSMFLTTVGKFLINLRFKVKNGNHFFVALRGTSKQVRPRTFPHIVELGSIPIAVPLKRQILLMNPLSVPMTLQVKATLDGTEPPLTFIVLGSERLLPLNVRNPLKQLEAIQDEYDSDDCAPEFTSRTVSQLTFRSFGDGSSVSSVSTRFEEEILDAIPAMACNMMDALRDKRFVEKPEADKRIITDALTSFTNLGYFSDFANTNFKYMDWNALPSDPQEIYVDSEVIHLSPNTGRTITLVLIPNIVGYFNRTLDIRCCPYNPFTEEDKTPTWVDSELFVSKLFVEYSCRVPNIRWDHDIDFKGRCVYACEAYPFEMCFENMSNVAGFFYFDVIPKSDAGEMFFIDNCWKHFLPAANYLYCYCAVIFKKLGDVELCGSVKFVGGQNGKPFHIRAHVLPPKVSYNPKSISRRFSVLQYKRVYIYIENVSATRTHFTLRLENEDFNIIEPKGGILSPIGQGVCAILHIKYYDPDIYKNTLYLDVNGAPSVIQIPITLNVEEMPILFEPSIKDVISLGIIFTTNENDFCAELPNFYSDIKVINAGYRCYRLKVQKLKLGNSKCGRKELRARINVTTSILHMAPQSTDAIHITAHACDEAELSSEFLIQIVDQTNRQRFQNIRLILSAKFINPGLIWSRKDITMAYCSTHKKEITHIEIVKLKNLACNEIEDVNVRAIGPFKIRELFEHPFKKELNFSMAGGEIKELTILLNNAAIKSKFCSHVDGRLLCTAGGRLQKPLYLRVNILSPQLTVPQPEVVLFAKEYASVSIVRIDNVGCLDAAFKWKKINETSTFIAQHDYKRDFAKEILSDLFRMLELDPDEDECFNKPDTWQNMTARYQECKCKLMKHKPIDPIGVVDILNEVIDALDLEHKRYLVRLGPDTLDSGSTATSCAEKTLDGIIKGLNLEESYEVSEVSSDDCDKERTIYFHAKCGVLQPNTIELCMVHLPAVRIGYAREATFQLDVIGGFSQVVKIILVNLEKTAKLSPNNIYLGIEPWYQTYKTEVKFQNETGFAINSCLEGNVIGKVGVEKLNRLSDGHVDVLSAKNFNVDPMQTKCIKLGGTMGFTDEFVRSVRVTINNSEEQFIRVRGQGIMPIFSMASGLKHIEQEPTDIELEYYLLQKIYYFDIFENITADDDDLSPYNEDFSREMFSQNEDASSLISSLTSKSEQSSRTSSSREIARNLRFVKLIRSYYMVNNAELPNATILEQLMETEKFRRSLSADKRMQSLLKSVYDSHVKEQKLYDPRKPFSLKYFTLQPLPFEMHGYVLNMNSLKINHYRKMQIDLQFHGPGKPIAAARTAIKIHGLTVYFITNDSAQAKDDEHFYHYIEGNSDDHFHKPYRNLFERIIDLEKSPRLKRAHSFDVDEREKLHSRKITRTDRKAITNYYNSLNKSVYEERKNHCILCKLHTKSKENISQQRLRVVLLFKPTKRYYEDGQMIEDYVYIDLHMGPTLPILMRGLITY